MRCEQLVLVPAGMALLVGLCLAGCRTPSAPPAAGTAARGVPAGDRAGALRLSGTVEAVRASLRHGAAPGGAVDEHARDYPPHRRGQQGRAGRSARRIRSSGTDAQRDGSTRGSRRPRRADSQEAGRAGDCVCRGRHRACAGRARPRAREARFDRRTTLFRASRRRRTGSRSSRRRPSSHSFTPRLRSSGRRPPPTSASSRFAGSDPTARSTTPRAMPR